MPCQKRGFFYPFTVYPMTTMTKPQTDKEALVLALLLSLTAPTDELAQEAAATADNIASRMSTDEVEACKAIALAQYQSADS